MPAPPVVSDADSVIRGIEILHEVDAQNAGGADGNQGISAEIAVDLEGKDGHGGDIQRSREVVRTSENRIDEDRRPVRNHNLHKITLKHHQETGAQPVIIKPVRAVQLAQEISAALNRAGHQLRKEGHEQGIADKIRFRRCLSPIDVNQVARRLEGEEGNTDRKKDVKARYGGTGSHALQKALRVFQQEVGIFEISQRCEDNAHAADHDVFLFPGAFRLREKPCCGIGHRRGAQDEQPVACVPAHVKIVAGRQQKNSSRDAVFRGNDIVQ